jgi:hypothetical protein
MTYRVNGPTCLPGLAKMQVPDYDMPSLTGLGALLSLFYYPYSIPTGFLTSPFKQELSKDEIPDAHDE